MGDGTARLGKDPLVMLGSNYLHQVELGGIKKRCLVMRGQQFSESDAKTKKNWVAAQPEHGMWLRGENLFPSSYLFIRYSRIPRNRLRIKVNG